jgi:hypothetical protein
MLTLNENNAYTEVATNGIPSDNQVVYQMDTQVSIGKDSIGKGKEKSIKKKTASRFHAPTLEEIQAYCDERNNGIDAERFLDYYTANGWVQGKGKPIKDWKATVRTWEKRDNEKPAKKPKSDGSEYADLT